jgi:hypothetical protein
MADTWIVENTWGCLHCGKTNKGRHMECQFCGASKTPDIIDRIPDPDIAPRVTDSGQLRDAKAGRNWVCEYCGSQVRNTKGECQTCAAERESDGVDHVVRTQRRTGGKAYFAAPTARKQRQSKQPKVPVTWRSREFWGTNGRWVKVGSVAAALGALVWLGIFLFMPTEVDTTVESTEWKYTQRLQERETRHGESWDDQRPASHFNDSCRTKQRGTEDCNPHDCNPHSESYQCNAHECNCSNVCTDNGNGYSTCSRSCSTCYDTCSRTVYDTCYDQCPVYDQWCSYDYYAWPDRLVRSTSGSDHEVHWPKMPKPKHLQRIKSESWYEVVFRGEDDSWKINPETLAEFKTYRKGDRWRIKVNRVGKVEPLRRLTAEQE